MATKNVSARLLRELKTAEANQGKYVVRQGLDYARFGYAFDATIADARDFAVSWRKKVLELSAGRVLSERVLRVINKVGEEWFTRVYKVYSVAGQDLIAVYARGSSNCLGRLETIPEGETAERVLRQDGWERAAE